MTTAELIDSIARDVAAEVRRAVTLHASMNSRHEAYAVILEELEEFWAEAKRKEPSEEFMRTELEQTAAMCIRAIVDLRL